MTDIRTMLHGAASAPSRPVSIASISQRARRRSLRHRITLGLASVGAVGGMLGGGQLALSPAGGGSTGPILPVSTGADVRAVSQAGPALRPNGGLDVPAASTAPAPGARGASAGAAPPAPQIAFVHGGGLYVGGLDGSISFNVSPVTQGNSVYRSGWSPDAKRLVWGHYRGCFVDAGFAGSAASTCPDGDGISVADIDGSRQRRLVSGSEPAWSPDGQRIVFVRDDGLYLVKPDLSSARLVPNTGGAFAPDWSPDGSLIAFSRPDGPDCQAACGTLWVVRPDGSGLQRIMSVVEDLLNPSWSPDGSRFVFVHRSRLWNGDSDLFVVGADGSGMRQITSDPRSDSTQPRDVDMYPDWTHDGGIVWARDEGGFGTNDGSAGVELYLMNPDGSGRRRLFPGSHPSLPPRR